MGRLIVRADVPDDSDLRKRFVTEGLGSGISAFVIRDSDSEFRKIGRFDAIVTKNGSFDDSFKLVEVKDKKSQEYAMSLADEGKNVIIGTKDWKVIPLENIIGKYEGKDSKVFAIAKTVEDTKLLLTTMEKGVDGVIIDVNDPEDLAKFSELTSQNNRIELSEVTITSIQPIEMGDRVCIDTCVSMEKGEGMLIGSYSNCLFLIQSESEESEYVASRPFRVNAGAVHSYIQIPRDKTGYLSEMSSGDNVLLCDSKGNTRIASVGRCKIERRPLLIVKGTCCKKEYSVILQNAETIRLVTKDGSISITELKKGDLVLAKLSEGGRHFGMSVDETVSEK